VRENGQTVLLSLMSAGAKSADGRQRFLGDLAPPKMGRPCRLSSNGNARLPAALDPLRPSVAHPRRTMHNNLGNLPAKAPHPTHEAVREDNNRIVYAANS
jgi:hypothetical protein